MVVLPQASLLVSTYSSALSAGMTVSLENFALLLVGQLGQRFSLADKSHSLCKPALKQASCSRASLYGRCKELWHCHPHQPSS